MIADQLFDVKDFGMIKFIRAVACVVLLALLGAAAPVAVSDADAQSDDWILLGDEFFGSGDERLGSAVALSQDGQTLVVGAATHIGPGYVEIYERWGFGWRLQAQFIGESFDERLGFRVAISHDSDHVAVGGFNGMVRTYRRTAAGWARTGVLRTDSGLTAWALDLDADGSHLIVGDPGFNDNGGAARVLQRTKGGWLPLGEPFGVGTSSENYRDVAGRAVSISADGLRAAVGAPTHSGLPEVGPGVVTMHSFDGDQWQTTAQILGDPDRDQFGLDLDLNNAGDRVLIRGPRQASLFEMAGDGWREVWTLDDAIPSQSNWIPRVRALAMNGDGTNFALFMRNSGYVWQEVAGQWRTSAGDFASAPPAMQQTSFISIDATGQTVALAESLAGSGGGRVQVKTLTRPTGPGTDVDPDHVDPNGDLGICCP